MHLVRKRVWTNERLWNLMLGEGNAASYRVNLSP